MDINCDNNIISLNKIANEKEKEEFKRSGPSELALSLRKKKINQIIEKNRITKIKNTSQIVFGNNELKKLSDLSKLLYEEKNIDKIIEILDQLYCFLLNFNEPIKTNYIDISNIIQHLYTVMIKFKNVEIIISKSFDAFEQIIRLTPSDEPDKYCRIFNEQYSQILYELIDYYQNNKKIAEKIFNFLTILIQKSDKLKEYLMTNTGFYFIQTVFSLDTKYPLQFIKLLSSFCSLNEINDKNMKEFQIMFLEKCDKIISLFYQENHQEPKNIINNSFLFHHLYKCLSYISQSINNEIIDGFFITKKNDVSLYEKILTLSKFDKDNLSNDLLIITGNLYCSSEPNHIQILIECRSYQYVMDILLQQYNNNNDIIKNAAWVLSNFVNIEEYRKIFIKQNYINKLIILIRKNFNFEVRSELLSVIANLLSSVSEIEIYSFIESDLVGCCIELLINLKEPNLLQRVLNIIQLLLYKGDPNIYLDCYYKDSDDKITNIYKYQFDYYGLETILNNIASNSKNKNVYEIAQMIIEHYYYDENKIITD